MKVVFARPNSLRPNLNDFLCIKTRSLGAGRGVRAYVSLTEGLDSYATGRRDFESSTAAWDWMTAMRQQITDLGWDERLPKRYRRKRR